MKIVGLDLSITATGIARIDGQTETVQPRPGSGDMRLVFIQGALADAVYDGCDLAVIEDLPSNAKSAGITGMVHGAVRTALLVKGIPYALVTPASLKSYATGKGNCGKPEMAVAAYKRAGVEFGDDNQCDAAWLRWMALDWYGFAEFEVPKAQRNALAKVDWPVLAKAVA